MDASLKHYLGPSRLCEFPDLRKHLRNGKTEGPVLPGPAMETAKPALDLANVRIMNITVHDKGNRAVPGILPAAFDRTSKFEKIPLIKSDPVFESKTLPPAAFFENYLFFSGHGNRLAHGEVRIFQGDSKNSILFNRGDTPRRVASR